MQAVSRANRQWKLFDAMVIGFILTFILALSACETKPSHIDLRARIAAAKTDQNCQPSSACFNPSILVLENGYDVTIFLANRPKHEMVRADQLASYLVSLPMTAWPKGPTIVITPTDDVIDGKAKSKETSMRRSASAIP
jgi:hypothetical protein